MAEGITWGQLEAEIAAELGAPIEARWIIERASGHLGAERIEHRDDKVSVRSVAHVDTMVARRRAGEPIQYALGVWAFRSLELLVDRRVLIPRPETELVAQVAIDTAREKHKQLPVRVVDLGTGSGAIALAVATELKYGTVEVWAVDSSPDALTVATANLAGIGRPGTQVRLVESDWFSSLPVELKGSIDVLVSNPPYVADSDPLDASVLEHEPHAALFSGPTGLECVEVILADAVNGEWLAPEAAVVIEIGDGQGERAAAIAVSQGYVDVEVRRDLAGRERILVACSR